ncbi:MAG: hypothetical protein PHN89_03925 [Candidatus Pacebacteria bacterium]|nr:hypothetical protein [Candidatus Paceibacterota bacterium]
MELRFKIDGKTVGEARFRDGARKPVEALAKRLLGVSDRTIMVFDVQDHRNPIMSAWRAEGKMEYSWF